VIMPGEGRKRGGNKHGGRQKQIQQKGNLEKDSLRNSNMGQSKGIKGCKKTRSSGALQPQNEKKGKKRKG